ncbi:MAG TPA: hypothetical protein VF502_15070 [Stellaceae bacterium]
MSALESLIRLHRWQLDERRRHVAELEELAERLREEQYRLDAESEREQAVAGAPPEGATYAAHMRRLIDRRRKLVQSRAEVAERIVRARDALTEALEEVKRYEIIIANRTRQQEVRQERRQRRTLDDLGGESFRRGNAGKE